MKIGARASVTVATGGDPVLALAKATRPWATDESAVLRIAVRHDKGCPCLQGHPMPACTCELVGVEGTRVA
jgi:hypothetical protein